MKNSKDSSTIFVVILVIILLFFGGYAAIRIISSSNTVRNNEIVSNYVEEPKPQVEENTTTVPNKVTPAPNITKEEKEIATYTTKIYDTDKNRIYNIKLACKTLNGHRIKGDEEFSFNNIMGSMGADAGYKKALGFDGKGNKIKVFGGGICQISSTLYNSALIAKLYVTERHAHSRRVNYVPKNKDATVFSGGPDLKFVNNTGKDIIIYAETDGYKVTVSIKKETVAKF